MTLNDITKTADASKIIIYVFKKVSKKSFEAGIALKNNEIKDIMKVTKSLINIEILLKGTTKKIISQEGGFLNFV